MFFGKDLHLYGVSPKLCTCTTLVYTCVVFVFRSLKSINMIPTTLTIVNRISQLSHLTVDVNPFHKTQVLS